MNLRVILGWLWSWLALLALSAFVTAGMHHTTHNADTSATQTTLALIVSWLALLLLPLDFENSVRLRVVVIWAALAAAGFLLLSLLMGYSTPGTGSVRLAGGVLILVLLFCALQLLARGFTSSRFAALTVVSLIAGAFLAAPLYLGVLAEQFPNRLLVANVIVAASPLSYFAGIIDYDYLRATWFYQHTPFGSLRFEYPDVGVMTVIYLLIAMAMVLLTARRRTLINVGKV